MNFKKFKMLFSALLVATFIIGGFSIVAEAAPANKVTINFRHMWNKNGGTIFFTPSIDVSPGTTVYASDYAKKNDPTYVFSHAEPSSVTPKAGERAKIVNIYYNRKQR